MPVVLYSGDSNVKLWSASVEIADGLPQDTLDGLHHGPQILSWVNMLNYSLSCYNFKLVSFIQPISIYN
jgi:hypothetical protein